MVAMILLRDLCYRARTIAASMAIDEPGAIGGAPFRAAAQRRTAGRNFLVSRGMTAQPSGEENYGLPLRQRRSRRSRPSARSAIFRGRMRAQPDRATITENMRPPRRAGSGRKEHERRHAFVLGHDMTRSGDDARQVAALSAVSVSRSRTRAVHDRVVPRGKRQGPVTR